MSTPVIPKIIRDAAVVIRDGMTFYPQSDIKAPFTRNTQETASDMFGNIGDTLESSERMISFTPVGEIRNLAKLYPYGPSSLVAACAVGSRVCGDSNIPTVIHTRGGKTYTFPRTGIMTMCPMTLGPRATPFGEMSIVSLPPLDGALTDDDAQKTNASSAFSDTSFDAAKVLKLIYFGALGDRETPFDNIGARDGFKLTPFVETEAIPDDNIGIADYIITKVGCRLTFSPNNFTEDDYDAFLNFQGSDVILPGQYLGRGPAGVAEDLILDSDALTATFHNVGIKNGQNSYGVRVDQNGEIEMTYKMGFTTGAPSPIFSLVIPS